MAAVSSSVRRTPLIAGNWKMNLDHLQAIAFVQKLAWSLKDAGHDFSAVEVAVFPPFTDLRSVQTLVSADKLPLAFGGQDVSEHESGAYTGEISATFLAAARMPLRDHRSLRAAHAARRDRRAGGRQGRRRARAQPRLRSSASARRRRTSRCTARARCPSHSCAPRSANVTSAADIVVAYEPVWAIGSGQAATPEQAEQVAAALRAVLVETLGEDVAAKTRILYGGSVKSGNIASFMREPNVDGALVGGASLDVDRVREHRPLPEARRTVSTAELQAARGAACSYTGRWSSRASDPVASRKVSRANSPGRPAGAAGHHQPPADVAHPPAQGARWRPLRHVRWRRDLQPRRIRVAERNLNRITVILGLIWITCIVVLGLITKFDSGA